MYIILWTRFWIYIYFVFILHLWSQCLSFGGFLIDLLCELIDWSQCDLDALYTLDEVSSSYLIYVLFILFIYLFALCYICFCLFILLISLFVVAVVAYSFFNSFYCSCSGFLCILLSCRLSVLCCLYCHCVLEPYHPFDILL